ncbi:MAG: rRNA maturation RNase YbeY [Dehalococcoidales bacterium]|nr:rRNA maturation RNase YbeY [Dehalococcoidales bacterium]
MAQHISPEAELSLVITDQPGIQKLNRNYLGRDRPTDVIAFAMLPAGEDPPFVLPPDGALHLGEVIVSYPQAAIQAAERGHSIEREVTILIIHGVLHLLGYGDETPELKQHMAAREAAILNGIEGRQK